MSNYRVCKTDTCSSLRDTSTLTYDIGIDTEHQSYIRITKNSESGSFDKKWFSVEELFKTIDRYIEDKENRFASTVWKKPFFKGKGNNTAAFLMAVFLAEGFVETAKKQVVKEKSAKERYNIWHRRTDKNISSLIKG